MKAMRFFMDTHERAHQTFPDRIDAAGFAQFYAQFEQACAAEGVVPIRVHVGFDEGRAFCLNMAPDAEAVRRAHARVGLPFDSITEITTASPADMFLPRS